MSNGKNKMTNSLVANPQKLDELVELAGDQCTGANPAYPLVSEIKQNYIDAYNGVV